MNILSIWIWGHTYRVGLRMYIHASEEMCMLDFTILYDMI